MRLSWLTAEETGRRSLQMPFRSFSSLRLERRGLGSRDNRAMVYRKRQILGSASGGCLGFGMEFQRVTLGVHHPLLCVSWQQYELAASTCVT